MRKSIDIEHHYKQGISALTEKKYREAANHFERCVHLYEQSDFSEFSNEIKFYGEDARIKHNEIITKHLNEDGFDEIEYEV